MKIETKENGRIQFDSIALGEVFKFPNGEAFYIKTAKLEDPDLKHNFRTNAVCLNNGAHTFFYSTEFLILIQGKFVEE